MSEIISLTMQENKKQLIYKSFCKVIAMKVLSIGNSFSQDAHKWLHKLAENNGVDLETVNLYIGGCSLGTHWKNAKENNADYEFELNGDYTGKNISIHEALQLEKWDAITVQQVSGLSGLYETYEPYLSSLISVIKAAQLDAKIFFHQTWAYERDSSHADFVRYDNNQATMFDCIKKASEKAAKSIGAELIPTGKVIQILRETVPEFDYANGGISLCRDGFHLSLDYGRFAAAAVWLHTLSGKKIKIIEFENFDTVLLEKIVNVVNGI